MRHDVTEPASQPAVYEAALECRGSLPALPLATDAAEASSQASEVVIMVHALPLGAAALLPETVDLALRLFFLFLVLADLALRLVCPAQTSSVSCDAAHSQGCSRCKHTHQRAHTYMHTYTYVHTHVLTDTAMV